MTVEALSRPERRAVAVSRRVRGLMAEQRMKGRDLAKALAISPTAFSRRSTGELPFSLDEIEQLAELLGSTEAYLLGFTDERSPRPASGRGLLGDQYAMRDLNPQPADSSLRTVSTRLADVIAFPAQRRFSHPGRFSTSPVAAGVVLPFRVPA